MESKRDVRIKIFKAIFLTMIISVILTATFLINFSERLGLVNFLYFKNKSLSTTTINDITKIYLCDFTIKRNNNELEKLKKELGEESTDNEEITVSNEELINKDINDIIYADLISKQKTKGMSDFAFVHVLILPALVLSIGIIICLISFALNLFG